MAYPSLLSSLSNPQPTDRLNSPSHSSLHQSENTAITEIETFVGTLASTAGTLVYDIRSPLSNGGGHVQTAVLGGTGQTTYNKGDLLVASSASVLTKLAVGTDNQILQANSSVATGVTWVTNTTSKVVVSVIGTTFGTSSISEQSVFSVSIPGSVLGTNNMVRAILNVSAWGTDGSTDSVLLKANYGGGAAASILFRNVNYNNFGSPGTGVGKVEIDLFGNGAVNAQYINLLVATTKQDAPASSITAVWGMATGTSSIASNSAATLGLTFRTSNNASTVGFTADTLTVEKIV